MNSPSWLQYLGNLTRHLSEEEVTKATLKLFVNNFIISFVLHFGPRLLRSSTRFSPHTYYFVLIRTLLFSAHRGCRFIFSTNSPSTVRTLNVCRKFCLVHPILLPWLALNIQQWFLPSRFVFQPQNLCHDPLYQSVPIVWSKTRTDENRPFSEAIRYLSHHMHVIIYMTSMTYIYI